MSGLFVKVRARAAEAQSLVKDSNTDLEKTLKELRLEPAVCLRITVHTEVRHLLAQAYLEYS